MPITKPIEQVQSFQVSRYEQTGDQLFICLVSTNNPVYLEHFFTAEEQQDIPGTIEGLVAKLQILDENYVAPTPVVSLMDTIGDITSKVNMSKVATKKIALIAERTQLESKPILETLIDNEVTP